MIKPNDDSILLPEHNLYIQRVNKYFEVTSSRPFFYIYSKALTASQDLDSQELTELKPANTQALHLTGIALKNDINLYMKYNSKELFGTKSAGYINQDIAPMFNSFNPDFWLHDLSPYARLVENAGLAITSNVYFYGTIYELNALQERPTRYKIVGG